MFPPMSFKTKPDGVDTINVMQTLQNGSSADMSFMMNVKYWMQVDVHVLELCGADMQVSGPPTPSMKENQAENIPSIHRLENI